MQILLCGFTNLRVAPRKKIECVGLSFIPLFGIRYMFGLFFACSLRLRSTSVFFMWLFKKVRNE